MKHAWFVVLLALVLPIAAFAATPEYTLAVKDHHWQPSELTIPANTRVKLTVSNRDATPEEIESHEFPVHKIIMPGSSIVVYVGPLKPGRYNFFGDFHQDTAQGTLIVE